MSLKIKPICRLFSTTAVFMLLFQFVSAQSDFSAVDALIDRNKKALGNNAIVVVAKDGKIVHTKTLGEYDLRTSVEIGASSKWLSGALAMKMMEEEKFFAEEPIVDYLPVFEKYLKNYITIHHCLTNTTGTDGGMKIGLLKKKKFESLDAEVNNIAAQEIRQNPGEAFYYGDMGMKVVGRIIEVTTRKTFERMMQEKITRPLKMRGTNFTNFSAGATDPAEGGKSTAQDYINFLNMLLADGMYEDKQILTKESVDELMKPQVGNAEMVYVPEPFKDFSYGYGTWIHERDGDGNGTIVSCPSLTGVWPWIDRQKKYACIIISKNDMAGQNRAFYEQLQGAVEAGF